MFYFFSAIPQVLGALAGLLGVFLLFKFQSLNKSIISFGQQILDKLETRYFLMNIYDQYFNQCHINLKDAILRNDQETTVSQVAGINRILDEKDKTDTLMHKNTEEKNLDKGLLKTFKIIENIQWSCLEFKDNLSQSSKRLFFNCAFVIVLSLACLPLIPILNNDKTSIFLVFIVIAILIWFSICVFRISWVVIVSLSHDYNDEKMPSTKGIFDEMRKLFKKRKRIVYKRQWTK
jgi:hypothetical protein